MKHASQTQPVIGLIGGIGSGKSLVAAMLAKLDCAVVDADKVGHELLERPGIVRQVTKRFGCEILDESGNISRAALGEKVFGSPARLKVLNSIVHKPLRNELERRIKRAKTGSVKAVVLDAALLLETDWHKLCDVLVYVDSPKSARLSRVMKQREWPRRELSRRENLQKPLDIKRGKADYIVVNNSSVSHLRRQVRLLYQRLIHPAE